MLTRGRDRAPGPLDLEALTAHLLTAGQVTAPPPTRIAVAP